MNQEKFIEHLHSKLNLGNLIAKEYGVTVAANIANNKKIEDSEDIIKAQVLSEQIESLHDRVDTDYDRDDLDQDTIQHILGYFDDFDKQDKILNMINSFKIDNKDQMATDSMEYLIDHYFNLD